MVSVMGDSEEEAARAYDVAAIQHRGRRVRDELPQIGMWCRTHITHTGLRMMTGSVCPRRMLDNYLLAAQAVTNFEARSYSEDSMHARSADKPPEKPSSARSVTGESTLVAALLLQTQVQSFRRCYPLFNLLIARSLGFG